MREPGSSSSSFSIRRQARGGAAWVVATAFVMAFVMVLMLFRWPDASHFELALWLFLLLLVVLVPAIWPIRRNSKS